MPWVSLACLTTGLEGSVPVQAQRRNPHRPDVSQPPKIGVFTHEQFCACMQGTQVVRLASIKTKVP